MRVYVLFVNTSSKYVYSIEKLIFEKWENLVWKDFFSYRFIETKMFRKVGARLFSIAKKNFRLFLLKQKFFFRHIFPVFNIFNFLDTFPIFIEIPLLRFRPSNEKDNFMHIIIKRLGLSCLLVRRTSENSENKKSPLQSSCVEKQ